MSKFKVGDRARVKIGLKDGREYNFLLCNWEMAKMGGKIMTITSVRPNGTSYTTDNISGYIWSDDMLEKPVKTLEDITTLESGDIITDGSWFAEILEVGKQTILVSNWTDLRLLNEQGADGWHKPQELIKLHYKIYTPEETDDKTEEAMKLLKEKGYKIVKE